MPPSLHRVNNMNDDQPDHNDDDDALKRYPALVQKKSHVSNAHSTFHQKLFQ